MVHKDKSTRHPVKMTIQHWQLRDLLCFSGSSQQSSTNLFSVYHNTVQCYDTATRQHLVNPPLTDLGFSPTTMTSAHGYLAVGGQRGQITIKRLDGTWMAQTTVSGTINNFIHLSRREGGQDLRLMICNNDETIKVFDVPSMQHITTMTFNAAVNAGTRKSAFALSISFFFIVSVSPSGEHMVCCGDNNQVNLFAVTRDGGYRMIDRLPTINDAGFSCAWNETSTNFAVATQDGHVCVWDVRQTAQRLATLNASQKGQKGACRVVKFTHCNGIDLIAFSEHVNRVQLVDARTFNQSQTIDLQQLLIGNKEGQATTNALTTLTQEYHISGLCFSPDCLSLWVGLESESIHLPVNLIDRRAIQTFDYL